MEYVDYRRVKLAQHPYAQASVRLYENGDVCFQSYNTDVLYFVKRSNLLYCTGTYSQTTRKQMGWFLREYFPNVSYQDAKICATNNLAVDASGKFHVSLTTQERVLMTGYSLTPSDFDERGTH